MADDRTAVRSHMEPHSPSGELLQAFIEAAGEGFFAADADGRVLLWNQACEELFGPRPGHLLDPGSPAHRLFHLDDGRPYEPDELPAIRALRGEFVDRERLGRSRGELPPFVLEVTARPQPQPDGRYGALVLVRDLTAQHEAEQRLREGEARFRSALDRLAMPFAVFEAVRDAAGRIVDLRPVYRNHLALAQPHVLGEDDHRPLSELIHPTVFPELLADYTRVIETGEPWVRKGHRYASSVVVSPPTDQVVDLYVYPLGDSVAVTYRDVTEQTQREAALKASEARFRATIDGLFDSLLLLSVVRDESGRPANLRYEYANRVGRERMWPDPDRLYGRLMDEVLPATRTTGLIDALLAVAETGEPMELLDWDYEDEVEGRPRQATFDILASRLNDEEVIFLWRDVTERAAAQRAVAESEARFRSVLENLTDAAILYTAVRDEQGRAYDLRYDYLNPVCDGTHWAPPQDCLGRTYREVYPELAAQGTLELYLRVLETGEPHVAGAAHRRMMGPDGPLEGYFDLRVIPLGDGVAMFYREVTTQVQAAAALRESEERFRAALTNMTDSAVLYSAVRDETGRAVDLRCEYFNPQAEKTLWRPPGELLGQRLGEVFPHTHEDGSLDAYLRVVETGQPLLQEAVHRRGHVGGRWREGYFDIRAVPLGDGLAHFHRDVTERVLAEQVLRDSEQRFRTALDTMLDCFVLMTAVRDEQGRIVDLRYDYINEAGAAYDGLTPEQIVGRTITQLFPDLRDSTLLDEYRQVVETGVPLDKIAYAWDHPGAVSASVTGAMDIRATRHGDGVAIAWRDVTERVRAEQALRESQERFRTCIDSLLDCFVLFRAQRDAQGKVVDFVYEYVNPAACENNGRALEDTIGRTILELMPEQRGELFARYVEVVETGRPWVIWNMPYEGEFEGGKHLRAWFDVRVVKLGDGLSYVWRDVTDRVRAEEALRDSEELFRGAFEQSPLGVALLDPQGRCLRVNRVLADLLETIEPHLLGHGYETYMHPQEREDWQARTGELLAGRRSAVSAEMRWLTERGQLVWAFCTRALIRDPSGEASCVILQVQDIGPRKLAEQELAQRQLELARSNQELAQFAHIASHDLQEPVRKLQVLASRLQRRAAGELDDQVRDLATRMSGSARRMSELIDALLHYSRLTRGEPERTVVSLETLLGDVLADLELPIAEAGARVQIGRLPTVEGNPAQLRELFANLVANAVKFRRPGVPPEIRITAQPVERGVELRVEDNGIGFEQEYAERIFHPFQQLHTRSEYPGTGMGLAIVQRVAASHGVEVRAVGKPGRGATFVLHFPPGRVRKETP